MKLKLQNVKKLTPKQKMRLIRRLKKLMILLKINHLTDQTLIVSNEPHVSNVKKAAGYVARVDADTIFMYLNPKGPEKIETLCHEMIHVKQHGLYELSFIYDLNRKYIGLMWKGKQYHSNNPNSPWEIEAYSNEKLLAKQLIA